jgi:hypothetical protein
MEGKKISKFAMYWSVKVRTELEDLLIRHRRKTGKQVPVGEVMRVLAELFIKDGGLRAEVLRKARPFPYKLDNAKGKRR